MKFSYKSITQEGERKEGVRESENKFTLARELRAEGETLLLAEKTKCSFDTNINFSFFSGVKMEEKIAFARSLSTMLDAGLSISRALSVIDRQIKNNSLKKIVSSINNDIKKGKTFSVSLNSYKKIFPPFFVSMVASGEESGKLSESLAVVASQMEKTYLLQKKIKGALIYPGIIITAMLGIGIFMLVYIVPTLTNTFKELGVDLPASTQFIISASDFFQANMILIGLSLIAFLVLLTALLKTSAGKRGVDFFSLHMPIVAPIVKEINSARTARTLSSLLSAGVSVVDALSITETVVQNSYYTEVFEKAKKNIEVGSPMSEVFTDASNLYPAFVGEMIAVGEETGEMSATLLKVALFYESEVEQKTKDMSTVVEPFLMLFVGVAVGFFAISMISPIYSIADKM